MPVTLDRDLIIEVYKNIPKADHFYNSRLKRQNYYPMERILLVCRFYLNSLWYEYFKSQPILDEWRMCFMTDSDYTFYKQIMPYAKKFLKSESFRKFMEDLEKYDPSCHHKQYYD